MNILPKIKSAFRKFRILISLHADKRMKERGFNLREVVEEVDTFEIIEKYEKDTPFPSYLIFAKTEKGRYFHMVVAYNDKDGEVVLITIYEPSPEEWMDNFKTRRKK